MMAMAQQFPHPGAMPGQGLTHGHPGMGPGNPHGMPPGQGGMNQMQLMGGGPGGPQQVSQAGMMGGMPQMGQPHASNPQLAHQVQIQNQHMVNAMAAMHQNNPQMRQQMLMRQQHALAMANAQGGHGMMGNPNGHPMMMANGMQGPGGVPRVNLPAHLQSQMPQNHPQATAAMQQQHLILQQQQQQIAAAHQATQQHMNQLAMQHQNSQPGPSPAPSASAQPPRPPSQVQNRPDQPNGPPTSQPQPPQQQPTPVQQPPQPPPQQQQHHQQQQQQPPQPSQQPVPGQQQGPPQQQSQPQQVPGTMAQVSGDMTNNMRVQMAMKNQHMLRANMMGAPGLQGPQGASVLTLHQFADYLKQAQNENKGSEVGYWHTLFARFFAPEGNLRQALLSSKDQATKAFEVSGSTLVWFYHFLFRNGVVRIEFSMEAPQEKELPGGGQVVEIPRASFAYWYGTTHQVVSTGHVQVIFDPQGKITLFDYKVRENKEYIDRSELVLGDGESLDQKSGTNSPKMSKKAQQQRQKSILGHPALVPALERRPIGEWGVPERVLLFLELAENFARMKYLVKHANAHPGLSAPDILKQVVMGFQNNPNANGGDQHELDGQMGLGPQGFPGGPPNQRTPGPGPPSFASPAPGAHLGLPGSMTASPAMMNHALSGQGGVPMSHNPSQGGSGNPSATASPNVQAGKKRRASQVKTEEDGMDKAKASPRMLNGPAGNPKRMKS